MLQWNGERKSVKTKKYKIGKHVCVPLYHGIPKELQTGWAKYGSQGLEAWDNTTPIEPLNLKDKHLYCGTCGRLMVKKRRTDLQPTPTAELKLL